MAKTKMSRGGRLALAFGLILTTFAAPCCSAATLRVGFYKGKCGLVDVESVVATVVASRFARDRSIVAALLRMQFHDCFVNVHLALAHHTLPESIRF